MKNLLSDNLPLVSIIVPCRNEERFIGKCLDTIIGQDYPKGKLEVLVVDGMSEDGTRELVNKHKTRYPCLRIIDNPQKITPCALNLGIGSARGTIIIRMDAHAVYQNDYVSKCVHYLEKYGADNVGCTMVTKPRQETLIGNAIAAALSSPFGVGNSVFRTGSVRPQWTDTVFGGCYRRDVFDRIGLFNENLPRGQDREFNVRLKKAGGRILLVPDIVSYYYARSNLGDFCKYIFNAGTVPFQMSKRLGKVVFSWRNLIPPLFFLALLFSLIAKVIFPRSVWLFLLAGLYLPVSLYFSIFISFRKRDARLSVAMPLVFLLLHIFYGFGSCAGILKRPETTS